MWKKTTLLAACLISLFCLTAGASSFDETADKLHSMDLLLGTEQGYELERIPSRAEAATMLVRLLGKEKEAKATNYQAPFTDVPDWAKPYVGWLYSNGLTNGTGEKVYSPNEKCTAQMYATFLLRALGYSDKNGDFAYQSALKFATDKSVVNEVNYSDTAFLRDHLVAMSYTALAVAPKSGEQDLLTKLVAQGAVDKEKATDTLQLFAAWRDYRGKEPVLNNGLTLSAKSTLTATQNGKARLTADKVVTVQIKGTDVSHSETITMTAVDTEKYSNTTTNTYALDKLPSGSIPLCGTVIPVCVLKSAGSDSLTYNSAGVNWLMTRISKDFFDGSVQKITLNGTWITTLGVNSLQTIGSLSGEIDGVKTTLSLSSTESFNK